MEPDPAAKPPLAANGAEATEQLATLLAEIEREFPNFAIVPKAGHRLSHAIDRTLRLLTFGGQRHYLTRYHTVIGDTLYVPSCWDDSSCISKIILLRHERVHLRQRRRYGTLLMTLGYLLWPFPVGLAYGRARLEWEAYRETLRAIFELEGAEALKSPSLREAMVKRFSGPDYLWMWPFERQVGRWFDEAVEGLLAEA